MLIKAQKILDKLVPEIPKADPRHWVTKAWQARTYQKNSEVREAERIFSEITSQRTNSVTLPGQRQAYYFIILGEQESFEDDNKKIDHVDLEKKGGSLACVIR